MSKLTAHKVLSFDTYGTLIDWEAGIHSAFLSTLPPSSPSPSPASRHTKQEILRAFHALEKEHQALRPSLPYSDLLTEIHPALASALALPSPTADQSRAFGASVGSWPAFPDTLAALLRLQKRFKLVILSNTDRASFAATAAAQMPGVAFDAVLTAQDIGSYKPDRGNFEYMLGFVGREWGVGKERVLQVAQSQFHDHVPAREVGVRSVWIVRPGAVMGEVEGGKGEEVWNWKFDTLGEMAAAVEREVSGGDGEGEERV